MPNGAQQRSAATSVDGAAQVRIWRSAESYVIQRIFQAGAAGEIECPAGQLAGPTDCHVPGAVTVRGRPAVLLPLTAADQWLLAWAAGTCRYETIVGPLTEAGARAYATSY